MNDPMSPTPKAPSAAAGASRSDESPRAASGGGIVRWLAGWVLVPALVASAIFGLGVHCGARNPDAWYTGAALWARDTLARLRGSS